MSGNGVARTARFIAELQQEKDLHQVSQSTIRAVKHSMTCRFALGSPSIFTCGALPICQPGLLESEIASEVRFPLVPSVGKVQTVKCVPIWILACLSVVCGRPKEQP